jgi:hypothetical protein
VAKALPKKAVPPPSHKIAPVRISAGVQAMARAEADIAGRSLAAQVDYWARLGRAVEASPAFSRDRVVAALEGRYDASTLSDEETEAFLELMPNAPLTPAAQAFYANMREEGGAYGLDEQDRLVRGLPGGGTEIVTGRKR